MALKQLSNNLIQITRVMMVNCYLVREDDGFTLVDAALPGSEREILEAARAHGGQLKRIIITHAHPDHIGAVDALKRQHPELQIYLSEREASLLAGDMTPREGEAQPPLKSGYSKILTTPDHTLHPGDEVGSLRVYAAPGHTPGQIALLDTRDNTLIVGDALHTLFGVRVAGDLNLLFPLPTFATWHKATSLQSAKALRALNPSRLAVGHGKAIENPAAIMDVAIQRAARNFNQ